MICYNNQCMILSLKKRKSFKLYRESLLLLPKQITDTVKNGRWTNAHKLQRPLNKIIVNGMGGSNLGAEIVVSLFKKDLKIPVLIEPGYDISGYVNKETAYIISSYSGTTEEPIAAYQKAKARGALVIAVTSAGGNKLSSLAKKNRAPLFEFPTKANPSQQPRLGLGASIASFIIILETLGALKNITKQLLKVKRKNSEVQAIAKKLKNKEIILVSGPLFAGNLKTLRNQINESGKNMASYLTLSDMNHHALEGLVFPKSNRQHLAALFVDSKLDNLKIQKRSDISQEIFRKNKILVVTHSLASKTVLEQGLELLQFGSWLSYYIANNNHVDPMSIPFVDWFKQQLAK